jgi:hypothetical protein
MNAIATKELGPVAPAGRRVWKNVRGKLGVAALVLAVMSEVVLLVAAGIALLLIVRLIVDVLSWVSGALS